MTGAAGRRIAVVLFNLGGPDGQEDVKPFLFNLFNDPAIIGLPGLIRTPLARLISRRRETTARANYALMGGGSPLLAETRAQAEALETALAERQPDDDVRAFVAMRYWSPLTEETAVQVAAFGPDEIVLLPLYPQFSTTTTESSLGRWAEVYAGSGASRAVCGYPHGEGWIVAQVQAVRVGLGAAGDRPVRVLFSAHGIPERLIEKKGDPYRVQVESTCAAIAAAAGLGDWSICYQSRVGPMTWLGPSTPEAIEQAGRDGVGVVVVPVAFVSEHVETRVELDIEYAELARRLGVAPYLRVPAVGVAPPFIAMLAEATMQALSRRGAAPFGPGCRGDWKACPCQRERKAA
jgi:ferrochelatase